MSDPIMVDEQTMLEEIFAGEEFPREPQQARGHATRSAIFEAAAELFERKGYSGTNTKEIAERAEIGVGTLYFYFRDKRQILVTMLAEKIAEYPQLGTVEPDALKRDPRGYIHKQLRDGFPYSRVYYGLKDAVAELSIQDAEFSQISERIINRIYQQLTGWIRAGKEADLILPALDAEATARSLATLIYGFYNLLPSPSHVSEAEFWQSHTAADDIVYRALFRDGAPRDKA